jgi:hypothetical protein
VSGEQSEEELESIKVSEEIYEDASLESASMDSKSFKESDEDEAVQQARALIELADKKKKEKEANKKIPELREELIKHLRGLAEEVKVRFNELKSQIEEVKAGKHDEQLISNHLNPTPIKTKKPKGEKSSTDKKEPTYEGRGKKAGTGEARGKYIASLNSGKIDKLSYAKKVGENTWSLLYEDRKDGGIPIVKYKNGIYDMPIFKEIGTMIGVPMKTKQNYIDWIK